MIEKQPSKKRAVWFWTKEDKALVRALSMEGKTCTEITEVLGNRTWEAVKDVLVTFKEEMKKKGQSIPCTGESRQSLEHQYEMQLEITRASYVVHQSSAPLAYPNGVYRGK
jgi:hypothetical protein